MEKTQRQKKTKEAINYKETKDVYGWRSLTRITSDAEIEELPELFKMCKPARCSSFNHKGNSKTAIKITKIVEDNSKEELKSNQAWQRSPVAPSLASKFVDPLISINIEFDLFCLFA